MASGLCSSTCGTLTAPPQSYYDQCGGNVFRAYGNPYFALIKCDIAIPAPLDVAAWQALVASGDVMIGPEGSIEIPAPSVVTSTAVKACGGATVMSSTYALTFTTYQTGKNLEDWKYFKELLKNHGNYRIIWFDCDGNVSIADEYVAFIMDPVANPAPAGSPGYEFTISAPPHPTRGDGDNVLWSFTAEIKLTGTEIICQAQIPGLFQTLLG